MKQSVPLESTYDPQNRAQIGPKSMPSDMDVVASALRAVGSAVLYLTRILRGQTRFGRWSSTADINAPLKAFAHFPVYLG